MTLEQADRLLGERDSWFFTASIGFVTYSDAGISVFISGNRVESVRRSGAARPR